VFKSTHKILNQLLITSGKDAKFLDVLASLDEPFVTHTLHKKVAFIAMFLKTP